MGKFTYTAKNSKGATYTRTVEAKDRFEIYDMVRKEQGSIISIESTQNFFGKSKGFFSKMDAFLGTVREAEKIVLARNLSTMIKAGLPLSRALDVMVRQTKNKKFKEKIKNMYMVNSFWGPLGGMENEKEPRQSKITIPTETISDDEQAEASVFIETNKDYLPKRFTLHYIAQWLCGENPSDRIASECADKAKYQLMSHIEKRELSAWHNDRKIPPKGDFGRDDGVVGPMRVVPGGMSYFKKNSRSINTILPEPYIEWQKFIMDKAREIRINLDDFLELISKQQGVLLERYNQQISARKSLREPEALEKHKKEGKPERYREIGLQHVLTTIRAGDDPSKKEVVTYVENNLPQGEYPSKGSISKAIKLKKLKAEAREILKKEKRKTAE